MDATLYWEDLQEGAEVTPLEAVLGAAQLFQMSAVTNNTHRIHYDLPWAQFEGYENIVIHGPFHGEVLAQTLQRWIGPTGWLCKLHYSNRRYAVLGETLTGRGRVTRLYEENGQHCADVEIWAEKGPDQVTAPGTATVVLPTRNQPVVIPR